MGDTMKGGFFKEAGRFISGDYSDYPKNPPEKNQEASDNGGDYHREDWERSDNGDDD
jgi:hypothetical protein